MLACGGNKGQRANSGRSVKHMGEKPTWLSCFVMSMVPLHISPPFFIVSVFVVAISIFILFSINSVFLDTQLGFFIL